ncbi:putative DNA alkylation repair enzyme [Acidisarcina polymorpha]|uniref:Putative DNA alkylation repair enzyme n=1 Tax=Acidisarcina polymorpha TaxID=2211140 RepID=A0A2Z5FXH9_9BACT|nr:DNA alkylation repair protein [Acidisarcina polymorpha]AXC11583.1 putative DNA alkylation repair enzyme [Acidisarcina polymorpha]
MPATAKSEAKPQTRLALLRELEAVADERKAQSHAWFFKTGKGEYGEGDIFLGITVPIARKIALRYTHLPLAEIEKLLASPIHEHRFAALEILVVQYERGDEMLRQQIYDFYLQNTRRANNWDLVDTSAPYIVGEHLRTRPRAVLDRLAASSMLWERRIAMVATLGLVRHGEIKDSFRIAKRLFNDKEPLIHKATGWILREAGKVSREELIQFLEKYAAKMPRTTLRYAIERFSPEERKQWLKR